MQHTCCVLVFFFFKQKTAYEMRISDWSSDVCSSDLPARAGGDCLRRRQPRRLDVPLPHPGASGSRHDGCDPCHRSEPDMSARSNLGLAVAAMMATVAKIGRASCRERVCQYV